MAFSRSEALISPYEELSPSLQVLPGQVTLQVGQSQKFVATMSGKRTSAVVWFVNDVSGGNSKVGTISPYGIYRAPQVLPSGSVVVYCHSTKVQELSASAQVNLVPSSSPSGAFLTISPTNTSLHVGQSQQFVATVSGTSNTSITWAVNGTSGGNTMVGTISPSGLYTAAAAVPSVAVTVTAQSLAQSTAKATAVVTLTTPTVSVSLSPTNPSLQVGQSLQFSAKVTGAGNTDVNWLVSDTIGGNPSLGTISGSGLYSAPAAVPSAPVLVTAQSTANPGSVASTAVSLTTPVAHHVDLSWQLAPPFRLRGTTYTAGRRRRVRSPKSILPSTPPPSTLI
jgi:hypothetical protein